MKIYKFGGASIKDSDGVKNLLSILNTKKIENTLLVVSAMGKTTNNFEQVVDNYFNNTNNNHNLWYYSKSYMALDFI